MRQKNNIPGDARHFLRREIDSTDFKNENLTTKIRRNKAEKPYFFKKNILLTSSFNKVSTLVFFNLVLFFKLRMLI